MLPNSYNQQISIIWKNMKKTKSNKKKWFSGKKQLQESSSVDAQEVVKPDRINKIEVSDKQKKTKTKETEAVDEAVEAPEAVDEAVEAEETPLPKNSRLARLDSLKERMNRKKIWK
jgi:hypothetical protein